MPGKWGADMGVNFVFNAALGLLQELDWPNADVRVILLGESSTVGDEPTAEVIDDFDVLDEVAGTGYERKSLESKTVTVDDENARAYLTAGALTYSEINVGYIHAMLFYLHVNDDTDSIPIAYVSNKFAVRAAAPASSGDTVLYVDPIPDLLPVGTELIFPNATIVTVASTAGAGNRSLTVEALPDDIALGAEAITPSPGWPIPTNGTPLTISFPDDLLEIANR